MQLTKKGAPNGVPFFVYWGKRARVLALYGCSREETSKQARDKGAVNPC